MTTFVYGYGQASLDPATPSTAEQEIYLKEACATLINAGTLPADARWAGFMRDEATDKPTRLRQRHGGSCLLASVTRNHVVMAMRHDIIFSSVDDASETFELVQLRRFRLIVLDCGLDISPNVQLTPIALAMKSLRQRERKRTKEEFNIRKRNGMPAGGRCPIGWEIVRAGRGINDCA
jgi:DNA invertase Pin-like site-specific DNA recombinase